MVTYSNGQSDTWPRAVRLKEFRSTGTNVKLVKTVLLHDIILFLFQLSVNFEIIHSVHNAQS